MKLEPGIYTAVATTTETADGPVKVQFGEASTGTKQCAVNFEIVGEGPFAGQTIMWFGFLTKDSAKFTLEALRNIGFKGDDISKINDQPLDQLVSLTIEESEYQGKTSLKVAWVNRHGGGRGFELKKPLAKNDMAKFAATLRAHLKTVPEVDGAKADSLKGPAAPVSSPPTGKTDQQIEDDLSF
jgi:hypothetical protein